MTGPALNRWEKIYRDIHERKKSSDSDFVQGLLQSKPGYIAKIAMLTTLSESNNLVIDEHHIALAQAIYEQAEPNMTIAFEGSGRNELSAIASQIERLVLGHKQPILKKHVYEVFYKDAKTEELDGMLDHLSKIGKIAMFQVTKGNVSVTMVSSPEIARKLQTEADQP